MPEQSYKLIFFTPPQALPALKSAIFATGAGTQGSYTQCCFTTPGVGQFLPGEGAKPAVGEVGQVQEVGEVRVEVACPSEQVVRAAVQMLKE